MGERRAATGESGLGAADGARSGEAQRTDTAEGAGRQRGERPKLKLGANSCMAVRLLDPTAAVRVAVDDAIRPYNWIEAIASARRRPGMFIGSEENGHLDSGIRAPLELVWEYRAFIDPERAVLLVSPHQLHLRCYTGPLLSHLEPLVEWEKGDILLQVLSDIQDKLDRSTEEWTYSFRGREFHRGTTPCGSRRGPPTLGGGGMRPMPLR